MKPLLDQAPPDIFSDDPEELIALAQLGQRFRKMDRKVLHDAVRLLTGSAADFLDDYFESDVLKGYLASSSIIGTKVGPYSQGSGLVLLYHLLGEHDGEMGAWSFHKGGNGGFTRVLARAAEAFGAEIRLGSAVERVITGNGRATGVALADGTELHAPIVVSALDPRRTFMELVDPRELPTDLVEAIRRFRFQGTSAKVNFALDGTPRYPRLGDRTDQYRGFTNIGPSMEYLERAFDDAKYGAFSRRPYLDCAIQSTVDPDMAPPGKAVMSCFVQYAPYALRESDWDTAAGAAGRHRAGDPRVVLPRLRRPGPPARGPDTPRHRAHGRPVRGQHLRRRAARPADVLLPSGARVVAVSNADRRLLPVRVRNASGRLRHGRSRQARGGPDHQGPGSCLTRFAWSASDEEAVVDFGLTPGLAALRERARRFVVDELQPLEADLERAGGRLSAAQGRGDPPARDRGWTRGRRMPKSLGGEGWSRLEQVIVHEQYGQVTGGLWTYVPEPYNVLAHCDDAQRRRYLDPSMRGERSGSYAVTEPNAGSDPRTLSATAEFATGRPVSGSSTARSGSSPAPTTPTS